MRVDPTVEDDDPCGECAEPAESACVACLVSAPQGADPESFWSHLDEVARDALVRAMTTRRVSRGETLVELGAQADRLFVVNFGAFNVLSPADGRPVAHIRAGELIGEIGFFATATRTATVVAARDSEVSEISRARFDALCLVVPGLERAALHSLALRLARLTRRVNNDRRPPRLQAARVVVLLAAGGRPISPEALAAMQRGADKVAGARLAQAADYDADAWRDDGFAVANWLEEMERRHDLLICLADASRPEWAHAALRSADQLILLAEGEPLPPSGLEAAALALFPPERRRLVRFHARRRGVVDPTAPWLAERPVFMTHHISLEDDADVDRLMRFLSGAARGFVAGGGGAYGPAHIGVLWAFRERGVDFDIHGGTSVGAIMAAGFSALATVDEFLENLSEIFIRDHALSRLTWPRYSLLDHTLLDRNLKRMFRGAAVEDLWKPYFAVATDLTTNSMRILRNGPVWEATRASCAIPGVLPPFVDAAGHLLVDGAVSDNAPLAPMKSLKVGPNVLVDLRGDEGHRFDFAYGSLPGRWELLKAALLGGKARLPRCPGPVDVILRSIFSNVHLATETEPAGDLVLHPPAFPGASVIHWHRYREIVEMTHAWAGAALDVLHERGDPALAALKESRRQAVTRI
jgi:NTE family protein